MKPEITKFTFPELNAFNFHIKYTETNRKSHVHEIDLHTHDEFEIYINLSGDVSFLVENRLYPLSRGDVIIARPGEHHHCVYRSDADHTFFWILFDANKNKELTEYFYTNANANFLSPANDLKNELIGICSALLDKNLTCGDRFYSFFRLLKILQISDGELSNAPHGMPEDLINILAYIDEHITENIKIVDISNKLYISESTIERRFKEYIDIKPMEFIRKKKLIHAAELLSQGKSVLNAGLNVGYSDNSYFIKLFKEEYGMTPYQYKKRR